MKNVKLKWYFMMKISFQKILKLTDLKILRLKKWNIKQFVLQNLSFELIKAEKKTKNIVEPKLRWYD